MTGAHIAVLVIGPVVAGILSAMIGVAVGTLIRNQAGAVVALAAYALLVDSAGRPDQLLLAPGAGAAVLIAWALAFVVAAVVRIDRSDV